MIQRKQRQYKTLSCLITKEKVSPFSDELKKIQKEEINNIKQVLLEELNKKSGIVSRLEIPQVTGFYVDENKEIYITFNNKQIKSLNDIPFIEAYLIVYYAFNNFVSLDSFAKFRFICRQYLHKVESLASYMFNRLEQYKNGTVVYDSHNQICINNMFVKGPIYKIISNSNQIYFKVINNNRLGKMTTLRINDFDLFEINKIIDLLEKIL